MSKSFPISDAGLGAFAYTFELLMSWMGKTSRWRTMPWMVTFFFILVVPLGLVHITLVILQPVVVGQWCASCLFAAFIMLLMIPLAQDERAPAYGARPVGCFVQWSGAFRFRGRCSPWPRSI